MTTHLYLGADVAKTTFVAARWETGTGTLLGEFPNEAAGFQQLADQLTRLPAAGPAPHIVLVLEPTGGYELGLATFAYQHGWHVQRPNPRQIRDWLRGQGQRAKSDPQDARGLAHYGAEHPPRDWQPLPPELVELDSLLRRRDDLTKLWVEEHNRLDQPALTPVVRANVETVVQALAAARQAIDTAIATFFEAHPDWQDRLHDLRTVPGLGPQNAPYVLVLLARWAAMTDDAGSAKGLTALVGLDPQTYDSGATIHKPARISRMGQRSLRGLLFMGALAAATRGHSPLHAFYDQLVKRGKAKMVALVAAAHKILVWAWAIYRHKTPFDATRYTKSAQPA
jgi:transposase